MNGLCSVLDFALTTNNGLSQRQSSYNCAYHTLQNWQRLVTHFSSLEVLYNRHEMAP